MEADLKCFWLNNRDPFLLLGPAKYESLHLRPQIGLIHDLITEDQAQDVIVKAKPYLKTTPYIFLGKSKKLSSGRTSKVTYMNEKYSKEAKIMSNNIEMLLGVKLKNDIFGSENFQVMNYGIGGKITPHFDSSKCPGRFT